LDLIDGNGKLTIKTNKSIKAGKTEITDNNFDNANTINIKLIKSISNLIQLNKEFFK
jgi:hypothetical protein